MKALMTVLFCCSCGTATLYGQSGPQIQADNHVTFQLRADDAKQVALRGQWAQEAIPLTKDDDESQVWTVTTDPVPAGVWEYAFLVDGLSVIDPTSPAIKPQREPSRSILHIAATPPNPWDFQDLPHGTVHQHHYLSKALGRPRELSVYTPPGYESSGDVQYPLLVLQHGSGDNHLTWVAHGKAHWILDSLIAKGNAKPMIVVMIDGHPMGKVPRENVSAREESLAAFEKELFLDALPLVEANYRVAVDREQRAIAGLSMGGWQAIHLGLRNLDRFAWVGSFSGAADPDHLENALADPERMNAKLKLLWIACGRDDFLLPDNQRLVVALTEHRVQHDWQLTAGDHSWPVWRRYLSDFVPSLFQP